MIMALGWILHMRICNQEIGVGDRYGVAPHLMPGEGGAWEEEEEA